jgi:signal transduction histidine kinase
MRLHLGFDATIDRVRLAGGDMQIRSAPGSGAVVTFHLPATGPDRLGA